MLVSNVLELVGGTPLIALDKTARAHGLKCRLLAKVDAFSAGGSVKGTSIARYLLGTRDGVLSTCSVQTESR